MTGAGAQVAHFSLLRLAETCLGVGHRPVALLLEGRADTPPSRCGVARAEASLKAELLARFADGVARGGEVSPVASVIRAGRDTLEATCACGRIHWIHGADGPRRDPADWIERGATATLSGCWEGPHWCIPAEGPPCGDDADLPPVPGQGHAVSREGSPPGGGPDRPQVAAPARPPAGPMATVFAPHRPCAGCGCRAAYWVGTDADGHASPCSHARVSPGRFVPPPLGSPVSLEPGPPGRQQDGLRRPAVRVLGQPPSRRFLL